MDRGKLIGVVSAVVFFIILIFLLILQNSDFDQQLIKDVEAGEPADKLIKKIEYDRKSQELKAFKHLESHVTNPQYWSQPGLASDKDFLYYKNFYDNQMIIIAQYETLRKQFVGHNITKAEFKEKASYYKEKTQ